LRALALVHERAAGSGVFGEVIRASGAELEEWFLPDGDPPPRDPREYGAVLAFGGGMHVDQHDDHPWLVRERALLAELLECGVPLLGVCLGAQLLAEAAGARARPVAQPEVGWHEVEVTAAGARDPLLGPVAPRFRALEWHSYEFLLPRAAVALASSPACLQAYRIGELAWGIQFHAEVTLADFEAWIDEERTPEELEHLGFEPESLRARTRASIEEWNELGRGLCGRFLDVAMA
jgi:GMP synthase (glutamine-hydrolysing)